MELLASLTLVFVAGLVTALATGIGALPFFLVDGFSDRWTVGLWGLASGIMLAASLFGLVNEGLAAADGQPELLVGGLLAGVVLVVVADRVISRVDVGGGDHDHAGHDDHQHAQDDHQHAHDHAGTADSVRTDGGHDDHAHVDPEAFAEGDLRKLALIFGVLTVHSFPEGVAVGVAFAELGFVSGIPVLGVAVPVLAIFMTVAISIHNIPEGLAISIPLKSMDVSNWRMVGAAVFSSLPQPIGAVIAFAFVRWAQAFLPFGFGFAAGAMIYLVLTEFVPEALEHGAELPGGGRRELAAGVLSGVALMLPLLAFS
ncbi:MAG: ZIP family metal transporter [Haloferacaceae archaeon]